MLYKMLFSVKNKKNINFSSAELAKIVIIRLIDNFDQVLYQLF